MEAGLCPNERGHGIERPAAFGLDLQQFIKVTEWAVHQHFIGERPQVFGWLQRGGVGRQPHHVQPSWDLHVAADMPTGLIQDKHTLLVTTELPVRGKRAQGEAKHLRVHRRYQQPKGVSRCRLDEGVEIAPLLALLHSRDRALAFARPDPAQERLEADALLIHRPQFELCRGMRRSHRLDRGGSAVILKCRNNPRVLTN